MANAGQAVLSIGGAVVGSFFGQPMLGYAIGSALGAAAFPTQNKVEGPRIDDPKIPGTEPGRPIPWIQGRVRLAPDFLWKSDVRTIATTTTSGGKGSEPETETTTYTYEVDLFFLLTDNIGLPDGKTAGVTRIWYNKQLIWTSLSTEGQAALVNEDPEDAGFIARAFANLQAAANTERWSRLTVYTGGQDQLPDPDYETAVGTDNAPAYRNRTSAFIKSFQLGGSPHLGLFEFEVVTKATGGEVDATVLLQADFDDGTAADISSYEQTSAVEQGSPEYSDGTFISQNTGGPGGPCDVINWSLPELDADHASEAVTIETRVNIISGSNGAGTFYLEFLNLLYDNLTQQHQVFIDFSGGLSGTPRSIGYSDGATNDVTSAYVIAPGYRHVALVIPAGPSPLARLYLDGVMALTATVAPITASALRTYGARLGAVGAGNPACNIVYDWVRVKLGEVYTGVDTISANFTPPIELPAPDADSDTLTPEDEDLDDVVSRICQRGDGLTTSQFSVTDIGNITDKVESLWLTQVAPARPTLEILADRYGFSCTVSDKIYFPRKWQAAVATIPFEDLGAAMAGSEQPEPLAFMLGSELELPAITEISFADIENDHQTDVQPSDRLLTAMGSKQTISVPMGMTKSKAKKWADQKAFDQLARILETTLHLDGRYAKLEPGDCVNALDEDGDSHRLYLKDRTDTWPVLVFKACRDDPTVADSDGITDDTFGSTIDIDAPVDTTMQLLDAPLLSDAYDGPHLLVAAKGADSPWPGGAIMRSNDDVEYQRVAIVTESAVFGVTTTALTDWTGPHVFDEMSSVTVNVGDGTLSSSTRAAMLADRTVNAYAVIKSDGTMECGQFRTATLVSTGVYKLTGLLRGLRGTEHAMTGHASGETFVLLDTTGLRRIDMLTNQLGISKYYKGVTFGRALSTADAETFTANGISLKPFAPSNMKVLPQTNGDIQISWRRRSRLAVRGISVLGQSIPLGEESESYEVDILDVGSPSSVVRTLSVTTNQATYTSAQRSADGLSVGSIVYRVYQISNSVNRGYPLEKAA